MRSEEGRFQEEISRSYRTVLSHSESFFIALSDQRCQAVVLLQILCSSELMSSISLLSLRGPVACEFVQMCATQPLERNQCHVDRNHVLSHTRIKGKSLFWPHLFPGLTSLVQLRITNLRPPQLHSVKRCGVNIEDSESIGNCLRIGSGSGERTIAIDTTAKSLCEGSASLNCHIQSLLLRRRDTCLFRLLEVC
jgi:hypothetical protein